MNKLNIDDEFSLRLFLSADLIGSTALKSKAIGVEIKPLWLDTFQDFYNEFPVVFKGEQQRLKCQSIDFWKGIGDELLWTTILAKGDDAISTLRAFKLSIEEYNRRLDTSGKKVRLKGTAWIAGFPITHRKVPLPNEGFDYIGPYIDTGFRLSKFASQMKMVISVDLAWLILICLNCKSTPEERGDLALWFDESESMKSVLGGKPYPIIWIKCESQLEALEYKLRHSLRDNNHDEGRKELKEFCEAFITSTDDKIILPYILSDDLFNQTPHKSYKEWCEQKDKEPLDISDDNQFVDSKDELAAGDLNENIKFVKADE